MSDLIQISPEDFSKFSAVAIEDNINEKYANKVRDSGSGATRASLTAFR